MLCMQFKVHVELCLADTVSVHVALYLADSVSVHVALCLADSDFRLPPAENSGGSEGLVCSADSCLPTL
jgi:hypothetical protein